jgi:hypothetical protein
VFGAHLRVVQELPELRLGQVAGWERPHVLLVQLPHPHRQRSEVRAAAAAAASAAPYPAWQQRSSRLMPLLLLPLWCHSGGGSGGGGGGGSSRRSRASGVEPTPEVRLSLCLALLAARNADLDVAFDVVGEHGMRGIERAWHPFFAPRRRPGHGRSIRALRLVDAAEVLAWAGAH